MQLEDQIRDTLASEAATIPAAALGRLRQVDYCPRAHSLPPRLVGGLMGCAAAGAGAVIALGGSAPQAAFAGWRATPTAAAADQTSTAEAQCAARLPRISKRGMTANSAPEVADTRGPYTLVVYDYLTCISGPGFVGLHGVDTAAGVSISTADRPGSGLFTIAAGPAPSDASTVTLALEGGSSVQATVANSRFAAWWPGQSRPTSLAIGTPSGTQTEPLSFPPPPALPAAKAKPAGGSQ